MSFLPLLLILLIILLPGLASWLVIYQQTRLSGLETVFVWLLAGTAVVSWVSLTLAEFALFSLPLLLMFVLIPSALIVGRALWYGRFKQAFSGWTWSWADGIVVILLLIGVLLSGRPSEYIIGGRDHGVYVNTGIHIAKTGEIIVHDEEITALPEELRETVVWPDTQIYQAGFPGPWSEGQRMSGLTIRDLNAGIYLPHAFHLYPALIAVFFAAGGVSAALFTTMFLALLGSLAIYVTTARLWGQPVGLLALLLLTFSVTQVWFTGYPTAEIMVQLFFWGGLFALTLLFENGQSGSAILAGICLGLLHLVKLDTVLIPVTAGVLFLFLWLGKQFKPAYWWGIIAYFLLSLQAILHASFIATIYFLDHAVRNLLPGFIAVPLVTAANGYPEPSDWIGRFVATNWPTLLLVSAISLISLVLINRLRPALGQLLTKLFQQRGRWQQGIVGLVLLIVMGTAVLEQFFTAPAIDNTMQAIHLSRLYLTRVGLLVGGVGCLLLFYQANSTAKFVTLFLLAGNIAPLYILGAGTSPDHFWVIRRFVPIAFPTFLLAIAWAIWFLWSQKTKWLQAQWLMKIAAVGILGVIIAGFLQHIRYIAGVVEYAGLTDQLEGLAEELPDEAILLIQTGTLAQQLSLPLWFLFDKSVFAIRGEVREDVLLETAVANWQDAGRSVYWLATAETPPPAWPNWAQQYQFSYLIDVPTMETPLDRIPHKLEQMNLQLDIYRFTQH